MNEIQLEEILRHAIGPRFLGVFSADELPLPSTSTSKLYHQYPYCFVANTDPSTESGSDWVAFYVISSIQYEFFDSFALPAQLYFTAHNAFIAANPPSIINHFPLQKLNSTVCGHYTVYFLYLRSVAHQSFDSIIRSLYPHAQYTHSDKTVKAFVDKLSITHRVFHDQ